MNANNVDVDDNENKKDAIALNLHNQKRRQTDCCRSA